MKKDTHLSKLKRTGTESYLDSGHAHLKTQKNYSVPDREYLAVMDGTTTSRSYLYGEMFDIYTDHNCLRWLMIMPDPSVQLMR